ncbi:hypothetical protein [Streptomyces acidicola]|uniref:hypothetical protein n=1 Tax=Streptomyces acidicola TaxID=2596892 RepID=UPI001D132987|nr:hypothetical protein [Streptomyces acidicola]
MNEETTCVRLLPWTGAHGQPCLLLTDGDGAASRLADRIETMQLDLTDRLLVHTGDLRARRGANAKADGEIRALAGQLANALADTLLIAGSRGARLAGVPRARLDGTPTAPLTSGQAFPDAPAGSSPAHHASALLTFPGRDLASAPAARRFVRDTARSWGISPRMADDLETIAGELVARMPWSTATAAPARWPAPSPPERSRSA